MPISQTAINQKSIKFINTFSTLQKHNKNYVQLINTSLNIIVIKHTWLKTTKKPTRNLLTKRIKKYLSIRTSNTSYFFFNKHILSMLIIINNYMLNFSYELMKYFIWFLIL